MNAVVRIADKKGRISLPGFANATVLLEQIGPNEYRVRKAEGITTDEPRFTEEQMPVVLSERDALSLLKSLAKPPTPNAAAQRAAKRVIKNHGAVGH